MLQQCSLLIATNNLLEKSEICVMYNYYYETSRRILHDFLVTVKAAPHECVIRTGQP